VYVCVFVWVWVGVGVDVKKPLMGVCVCVCVCVALNLGPCACVTRMSQEVSRHPGQLNNSACVTQTSWRIEQQCLCYPDILED